MRKPFSLASWLALIWVSFGEGARAFRVEPWTYHFSPHATFKPFPIDVRFTAGDGFEAWPLLLGFAIFAIGAVVLARWPSEDSQRANRR